MWPGRQVYGRAATFPLYLWPGWQFEGCAATFLALLWPEREARVVRLVGKHRGLAIRGSPATHSRCGELALRALLAASVAPGRFRVHRRDYERERGRLQPPCRSVSERFRGNRCSGGTGRNVVQAAITPDRGRPSGRGLRGEARLNSRCFLAASVAVGRFQMSL